MNKLPLGKMCHGTSYFHVKIAGGGIAHNPRRAIICHVLCFVLRKRL